METKIVLYNHVEYKIVNILPIRNGNFFISIYTVSLPALTSYL